MGEELLSKKDILKQTGISYGQFYRWKRMGLIPESWFVRKSTFTGQEAFLPQEKVLARIERIVELKDEHSLDEIAELLLPTVIKRSYAREDLLGFDWIGEDILDCYDDLRGEPRSSYGRNELIHLMALVELWQKGLSQEEIELAMLTLLSGDEYLSGEGEQVLIIARKKLAGSMIIARTRPYISFALICSGDCHLDPQTEVAVKLELSQLLEEIKIKIRSDC